MILPPNSFCFFGNFMRETILAAGLTQEQNLIFFDLPKVQV